MLSKYVNGVEFSGDFTVSSEDIIRTREAVIKTIKKELPTEAQRSDVVQFLLEDLKEVVETIKLDL